MGLENLMTLKLLVHSAICVVMLFFPHYSEALVSVTGPSNQQFPSFVFIFFILPPYFSFHNTLRLSFVDKNICLLFLRKHKIYLMVGRIFQIYLEDILTWMSLLELIEKQSKLHFLLDFPKCFFFTLFFWREISFILASKLQSHLNKHKYRSKKWML